MSTGGWIFLIASWGIIIVLVFFSFYKVLSAGPSSASPDDSD